MGITREQSMTGTTNISIHVQDAESFVVDQGEDLNAVLGKASHTGGKRRRRGKDDTVFKAADDELQIVYGEVYIPNVPDTDGDFMTPEEVRKMAHRFVAKGTPEQIDIQHDGEVSGAHMVESFVAREGDDTFIPGSWVIGVHIPDETLWKKVKDGELNGFSMEAFAKSRDAVIKDVNLPAVVKGATNVMEGHDHEFEVTFDRDGVFLGGVTSEDGNPKHKHIIKHGTVTEDAAGHNHRFASVDDVVSATTEELPNAEAA